MTAITVDTSTTNTTNTTVNPTSSVSTKVRPVWQVGVAATVLAAVTVEAFGALARGLDVPLKVDGEAIPGGGFLTVTLMWGLIGTIGAVVLARKSRHAARIYAGAAIVVFAGLSVMPFVYEATAATRVTLELSHLLVAAIIVPVVTRRLAQEH
jgi:hypothetical protein